MVEDVITTIEESDELDNDDVKDTGHGSDTNFGTDVNTVEQATERIIKRN